VRSEVTVSEQTIRVLIADDDRSIRRLLRMLLTDADGIVAIAEAENGEEAVEMTEQLRPDVVLVDSIMPRLDIVDAVRLIRAREANVGIVVLASYDQRGAEALEAGANAYILKDAEREALLETIRRVAAQPPKTD
jgi:DNA-binding NarL/FixJ family response regulator